MIILPINTLAMPIVLTLCLIDAWMVFAAIALILQWASPDRWRYPHPMLKRITEAPARFIRRRLATCYDDSPPAWIAWSIAFGVAMLSRHFLILAVFEFSPSASIH